MSARYARAIVAAGVSLPFIALVLATFGLSLTDYALRAGSNAPAFVGAQNYVEAIENSQFAEAFWRSAWLATAITSAQMVLGLAVAIWILRLRRFGEVLLPIWAITVFVPATAAALTWRLLFEPTRGPLQLALLEYTGLVSRLSDPVFATVIIGVVDTWQWLPLVTLFIYAALTRVPKSIQDAARVDGLTGARYLVQVAFPLNAALLFSIAFIRWVDLFKLVEPVIVLTGGGPGNSTQTVDLLIWRTAFKFWRTSDGAAMSILSSVIVIAMLVVIAMGWRRRASQ